LATHTKLCIISPIDSFARELLEDIGLSIGNCFGLDTDIQILLDDLNFAFDHNRNQYHSTPILEKLCELSPVPDAKIVALTTKDLFIPILTHVYGEAQLDGMSCIVSSSRLQENLSLVDEERLFYERIYKEVLHELGHTYNLLHCKDSSCIMHYCRSIRDVDQKSMGMCRYCRVLLDDQLKKV
jgi:archaemetzincin